MVVGEWNGDKWTFDGLVERWWEGNITMESA